MTDFKTALPSDIDKIMIIKMLLAAQDENRQLQARLDGTGFITLPLVLHLLSSEEIGMNYLMMTVSSLVALLDFGFSPQFGRNFTYINSGAKRLLKEGVEYSNSNKINYHLLATLLKTARFVYHRLSIIRVSLMLTVGTAYIYYVTKGFSNVRNSFWIWILFSLSNYFNVYYSWLNSLLTGSGKVAEANIATILSRIAYLIICITLLLLNCGLFSIVIASFISPFIQRIYAYRVYFTKELNAKLEKDIPSKEVKELFSVIWFNAKKLGINFIGGYCITKSDMFIIGFFLPLSTVASYGLMTQLANILSGVAMTLFIAYQPKFSNYRVKNDKEGFKQLIGLTIGVFWIIMFVGIIAMVTIAPPLLRLIGSNTDLPVIGVVLLYMLTMSLEYNHSLFAEMIVTGNDIPFVTAGIVSGICIVLLTVIFLRFTNMQLLGVVFAHFIVQIAYSNWRWPKWIFEEFNMSISDFFRYSFAAIFSKTKNGIESIRNKL